MLSGVARIPLLRNLLGGLRLLAFLPLDAAHFVHSPREVLLLTLLAALIWVGYERVLLGGEAFFAWYGAAQLAWLALIVLGLLVMLTPVRQGTAALARSATAVAGALPFAVGIALAALHFSAESAFAAWVGYALATLAAVYLYRVKRCVGGEPIALAFIGAVLTVIVTAWVYAQTVAARPELWYAYDADDDARAPWHTAEETLFRQSELIDRAVESLAAGEPGRTELYFVGFAGDGQQWVFAREVDFARGALGRRFDLHGRTLVLANSPEPDAQAPLASAAGLRRALHGVARRMNVDEDALFLFLTSHGSGDASLAVNQSVLPFNDLRATELAEALEESGIRWRIVVISACYSGSFIEPLKNDRTLVITAAGADRTSFGCTDERELTYFGEALFRDALPVSSSLLDAARRARDIVTRHEKAEGLVPSEPQIFLGTLMRAKLEELPLTPAADSPH